MEVERELNRYAQAMVIDTVLGFGVRVPGVVVLYLSGTGQGIGVP
jgi:hypothetical protein